MRVARYPDDEQVGLNVGRQVDDVRAEVSYQRGYQGALGVVLQLWRGAC